MANFEYIDKLVAPGFHEDLAKLEKALPVLTDSMTKLSKEGKAVYDALGGTKSLKDMVTNSEAAATVNRKVATTVDLLGKSYQAADILKAKYNGSTKDMVAISEKAAKTSLTEAKAATELAKQKEIETRLTISLTKEKERLDKAATKEIENLKKQQSEYNILSQQYKKAAEEAQNLGAKQVLLQNEVASGNNVQVNNTELARLGPELKAAQENAFKLHTALLSVDQAVGKSQRNVGNYNSAQFAMSQLLREAPSFAYSFSTGILALSNNIPILVDEITKLNEVNKNLKATGEKTVPVWKTLMGAITSPAGLITIAVSAITLFTARWKDGDKTMTEAEKSAKKLNDTIRELGNTAARSFAEELTKTNELFSTASDLGLSYTARNKAIEDLIKLYPQLLQYLDQEAFLNGKVADRQDVITSIISKKTQIKYFEDLAAAYTKQRDELKKTFDESNNSGGFYNPFSSVGTQSDIDNQNKQIQELNKKIEDAADNARIFRNELKYLMDPKDSHQGRILSDIDAEIKLQETIRDTTTAEDAAHKKAIARLKELAEERRKYLGEEEKRKNKAYSPDYDNLIPVDKLNVHSQTREQYDREREERYQLSMAAIKKIDDAMQEQKTKDLNELNLLYENGTIKYEEHTKRKAQLDDQYLRASLTKHLEFYQALQKEYPDEERLKKLIRDTEYDLAKLDVKRKDNSVQLEFENRLWQALSDTIGMAKEAVDDYYQRQIDNEERLLAAIQKRKDRQINAIQESLASEKDKADQIKSVNAQSEAQELQINQNIRRFKRQMAIADRAAALANIASSQAQAQAANLANFAKNPVYGAAIAALIAGLGIAQTALVLSKPLPEYGVGTPKDAVGHPGGPAVIGDAPEWVIEPGKQPYFTNKTHVRNLPRYTRVVTQKDILAGSTAFLSPQLLEQINISGGNNFEFKEALRENANAITSAIKNQPVPSWHLTDDGFRKTVNRGNTTTTYLNKNIS